MKFNMLDNDLSIVNIDTVACSLIAIRILMKLTISIVLNQNP